MRSTYSTTPQILVRTLLYSKYDSTESLTLCKLPEKSSWSNAEVSTFLCRTVENNAFFYDLGLKLNGWVHISTTTLAKSKERIGPVIHWKGQQTNQKFWPVTRKYSFFSCVTILWGAMGFTQMARHQNFWGEARNGLDIIWRSPLGVMLILTPKHQNFDTSIEIKCHPACVETSIKCLVGINQATINRPGGGECYQ